MAVTKRFYLNCPYAEKNQAKDLGARWDNDAKKWYVPNDVDRNLFKRWWPTGGLSLVEVGDEIPF